MFSEDVQPQPNDGSNSETDLGALAEHLSVIADALRKSTGDPADRRPADRRPADRRPADARGARPASGTDALLAASSEIAQMAAAHSAMPEPGQTQSITVDAAMQRRRYCVLAREAYATRRRRSVIFQSDELFGEPAWDILLDLYIAQAEGKRVSVSSACIGSAAPPTTGLRWLGVLAEHKLVLREHDPEDQRRVLVRLTEKGLTAMDDYFTNVAHAS